MEDLLQSHGPEIGGLHTQLFNKIVPNILELELSTYHHFITSSLHHFITTLSALFVEIQHKQLSSCAASFAAFADDLQA